MHLKMSSAKMTAILCGGDELKFLPCLPGASELMYRGLNRISNISQTTVSNVEWKLILIRMSRKFVPKGPIEAKQHWFW